MAKNNRSSRLLRYLGYRRLPRGAVGNFVAESLVVIVLLAALAAGWLAVRATLTGYDSRGEHAQALAIADAQLAALRSSGGLSVGEQCFDAQGNPRSGADPAAPCSYGPQGKTSGCLASTQPYCYLVQISSVPAAVDVSESDAPVTYTVRVTWGDAPGGHGQVVLSYRLLQSNTAYDIEKINTDVISQPGFSGPKGVPNGIVGGTGTVDSPLIIHMLGDIAGGPAVTVNAATCSQIGPCPATGAYDLKGRFSLTTNMPDYLIASCTWDFGDGSPQLTLTTDDTGCLGGQAVSHSYQNTWQMQPLPPYPMACFNHGGTGLDSAVFPVTVTLHSTSGATISSAATHRAVMPSCP